MDTGAAVAVITFQPSQDQAVLVAAAAGRDAVEARLRPQRAVDRVVHLTSQRGAWVGTARVGQLCSRRGREFCPLVATRSARW
jgi:hypothetical protein